MPDGPVLPHLFPLETSGIVAMVLGAAGRARWRAGSRASSPARCAARAADAEPDAERASRRRDPVPGVDGLAVATGVWICALAAITWAMNPYAAGVLVLATHLWLFAAGGWRGWPAVAAVLVGLAPIVLIAVHYGFALDLGPLGLAWGAALAAGSGSGLWSTLLLGRRAGRARGGRAGAVRAPPDRRDGRPERASRSARAGRSSYAGPGSLGGTESALRR